MRWLHTNEDLRGEPPARVVFCERELYVLGVSASGRNVGCGGEDWEVVVLMKARRSRKSNANK